LSPLTLSDASDTPKTPFTNPAQFKLVCPLNRCRRRATVNEDPGLSVGLMRYEKIVAGIGLGIVCFAAKMRSALSRGSVAALGCMIYEVVKAHGPSTSSRALADAESALAKAEACLEAHEVLFRGDCGEPCCGCEEGGLTEG
jgi:hypothetical protein